MKQFSYTITDPVGIHALPAGLLAKAANEATQLGVSRDELHSMLDLIADESHTEK